MSALVKEYTVSYFLPNSVRETQKAHGTLLQVVTQRNVVDLRDIQQKKKFCTSSILVSFEIEFVQLGKMNKAVVA